MNKSEIELQNIQAIIDDMPANERATCVAMIQSLMMSIGNPIHGRTFMIAIAYANCQVAVHNIKMGLVNSDESEPAVFMQGDGRPELIEAKLIERNSIEEKAKEIYNNWHTKDGFIKWVEGGNSVMQDEARRMARIQIEELAHVEKQQPEFDSPDKYESPGDDD